MFNLVLVSLLIIVCANLIYSKRALEKKEVLQQKARHWYMGILCLLYFLHVIASQVKKKKGHILLLLFFFLQRHMTEHV